MTFSYGCLQRAAGVSNSLASILPRTDTIVPFDRERLSRACAAVDEASTAGRILVPDGCFCAEQNIQSSHLKAGAARQTEIRYPGEPLEFLSQRIALEA